MRVLLSRFQRYYKVAIKDAPKLKEEDKIKPESTIIVDGYNVYEKDILSRLMNKFKTRNAINEIIKNNNHFNINEF
jgi:hypothetical protein